MNASRFEYRFRFALHAIIFFLGFMAPWDRWLPALDSSGVRGDSTWLILSTILWRQGWFSFQTATVLLLVFALVFTGVAAWLRTWGTAYVSAGVMRSRSMHGQAMLADGPFRRTRNPLYLGTLLHTIGVAILMPPTGAVFAMVAIWVLQIRLARAEEPYLLAQFGQPYAGYLVRVPRFIPALHPRVPSAGATPHWFQAILGELYFIGVFITLAAFGWSFNANPLRRGILISLGLWFIALALLPRAAKPIEV
jgi:protein-S-isoprenylcysteine O-methyltransferase Ste14